MKTKSLIVVGFIFLYSCTPPSSMDEKKYEGFEFRFTNYTNREYIDANLFVGGIVNGVFMPTDSILITPKIKVNGNNNYYFIDESRWNPDLSKIREIPSVRCYFLMKLSNNRKELIKRDDQTELFSLFIPDNNIFIGDDGTVFISIRDNGIIGSTQSETN